MSEALIDINVIPLKIGDSSAGVVVAGTLGIFLNQAAVAVQRSKDIPAGAVCIIVLAQ